ncbi:carboxylesterase family protein [Mycobacteroides franklinii]|uniref:carboxylesterase family protein n=1 Tax=Mycobacteroides franklinii TaxID=948102 RepID=UPI0019D4EECE
MICKQFRYASAKRFGSPCLAGHLDEVPEPGLLESYQPAETFMDTVLGKPPGRLSQGEDCLQLRVCTNDPSARRPVMVYVHGGGFFTGSGLWPWYSQRRLVLEHDVVAVNINYRLGALGLAVIPSVCQGNIALLDQIAALQWVQRYIGMFGGDPENVTVYGQSAGAMSILNLLRSSAAAGLFRRAILQSPLPEYAATDLATNQHRTGLVWGRSVAPDELPAVASFPAEQLAEGYGRAMAEATLGGGETLLAPVIGQTPLEGPADWHVEGVDVLAGWTHHEMGFWGVDRQRVVAETSKHFAEPITQRLNEFAKRGANVAGYRIDWEPKGSAFGACHCVELPLLLGTEQDWEGAPILGTETGYQDALGLNMRRQWAQFATTGHIDPALDTPGGIRYGIGPAGIANLCLGHNMAGTRERT